MYELVQVSEKCYYINCPAKIGVYVADQDHVYLVDSGNDKDAGRKVRQILDKNGWHLAAILNTHSNADHIGGNRYVPGADRMQSLFRRHRGGFYKVPAAGAVFPLWRLSVQGFTSQVPDGAGERCDGFFR